jgi:hypothetical protein
MVCLVLSVDYVVKLLDEVLFVSIHGVSKLTSHVQETEMV